jgi:hypothetical protein
MVEHKLSRSQREHLEADIRLWLSGDRKTLSVRKLAKKYSIVKSTVEYHIARARTAAEGPPPILSTKKQLKLSKLEGYMAELADGLMVDLEEMDRTEEEPDKKIFNKRMVLKSLAEVHATLLYAQEPEGADEGELSIDLLQKLIDKLADTPEKRRSAHAIIEEALEVPRAEEETADTS